MLIRHEVLWCRSARIRRRDSLRHAPESDGGARVLQEPALVRVDSEHGGGYRTGLLKNIFGGEDEEYMR